MFNKTLAYARLEWFLACQKVRRTEPLAGHGKLDARKIIGFVLKNFNKNCYFTDCFVFFSNFMLLF